MIDPDQPKLSKTALEFIVQTDHQPLYRKAELLLEREQECTQLGYDRAVAELADKLSKEEQGATDPDDVYAADFRSLVEHVVELGMDGKSDAVRGELRRCRHLFEKKQPETSAHEQPESAYERDQRFQSAYLAVPSDVRGRFPRFEEFKRVLEEKQSYRRRTPESISGAECSDAEEHGLAKSAFQKLTSALRTYLGFDAFQFGFRAARGTLDESFLDDSIATTPLVNEKADTPKTLQEVGDASFVTDSPCRRVASSSRSC